MFSVLKSWITSIVVVVIFMALIDIILPSNSLKKYARLVFGLIVIVIIINPLFSLFSKNADIEASINQYMDKYNVGSSSKQNKNNYINSDTILIFKENLKSKIEKSIYDGCSKQYKVTQLVLNEDQSKEDFLNIKFIELKLEMNSANVEAISKVVVSKQSTTEPYKYFWDKEAANILDNEFAIKTSNIKFVR
jgi:stage III sporulation protein AF